MRRGIGVIAGLAIMAAVFFTIAAAADAQVFKWETKVEVKNDWNVKMWISFKCYTSESWEQNDCLVFNTPYDHPIAPGATKTWKKQNVSNNPAIKCNQIYTTYGRGDRSCDAPACKKTLIHGFAEGQPMRFRIIDQAGDFIMVPQ